MEGPLASGGTGRYGFEFRLLRATFRRKGAGASLTLLSIVLLYSALLLHGPGCADPSAVGRFASVGKAADESFSSLAKDFTDSCLRGERYRLLGEWQSDIGTLEAEAARSCKKHARAAKRVNGAHRVLIRYLSALGELAGGDLVSYDDSIGELAGSLEDADMLGDEGVDAVTKVCAVLMDAAAGKWRRRELGSAIERANADVRALAEALRGVVEEDYARILDDESEAARKFYLGKLREHGNEEPLASVLVYAKWEEEEAVIEGKRKAAEAYVKVLDKIIEGHQDLYDRRDKLDSKETRKLVLKHVTAIEDLLSEVQQAF
jgi:hypothetical protein